jgi:hypothetical protein
VNVNEHIYHELREVSPGTQVASTRTLELPSILERQVTTELEGNREWETLEDPTTHAFCSEPCSYVARGAEGKRPGISGRGQSLGCGTSDGGQ